MEFLGLGIGHDKQPPVGYDIHVHMCTHTVVVWLPCKLASSRCLFFGSDLFWEAHYNIQDLDMTYGEELDKNLKQYSLPEAVETLIERGEYDNKESEVTRVR